MKLYLATRFAAVSAQRAAPLYRQYSSDFQISYRRYAGCGGKVPTHKRLCAQRRAPPRMRNGKRKAINFGPIVDGGMAPISCFDHSADTHKNRHKETEEMQ